MSDETMQPVGSPPSDAAGSNESGATRYSNAQLGRTRELLTRLYASRRAAFLYPFNHPAVQEAVIELFDAVVDAITPRASTSNSASSRARSSWASSCSPRRACCSTSSSET